MTVRSLTKASRSRLNIAWRDGRWVSFRSWNPKAPSLKAFRMNTASTSSASLGGPKPVPRSCARRKTIFPDFSSNWDMCSLLRVRDANDFARSRAGRNVIETDGPLRHKGGSKQLEHLCVSWLILVSSQLQSERAHRIFGEPHDHLAVEKIRRRAKTAAEFVSS